MQHPSRERRAGRFRPLRRCTAIALALHLVASCTADEAARPADEPSRATNASSTSPRTGTPTAASSSAAGAPGGTGPSFPQRPPTRDAAELADLLDQAVRTVHDPDSADSSVRRAAQFQQLAVRALVTAPRPLRAKVLAQLRRPTTAVVRREVTAAAFLRGMTAPQDALPRWRIVAPPPPDVLLRHYRTAQRRTGVPWTYLAAIHLVETRMGRIRGTSSAGARGPMQFLPSTWELYGGRGDINDPQDAIVAAGRLLRANGAPADMAEALWHYNPSESYVRAVTQHARVMERSRHAYRGYWHWRVLYRHERGTYVLPVGYPDARPVLLRGG